MAKQSAGILLYKYTPQGMMVLLVHPGGPFWAKKDQHAWSIPKGEYGDEEDPLNAAKREFREELGSEAPKGDALFLGMAKQPSGKRVSAWALEGDFNTKHVKSNMFDLEWPPKSGQIQQFPEVDKAAWLSLPQAREKLSKGQLPLLEKITEVMGESSNHTVEGNPNSTSQTSLL